VARRPSERALAMVGRCPATVGRCFGDNRKADGRRFADSASRPNSTTALRLPPSQVQRASGRRLEGGRFVGSLAKCPIRTCSQAAAHTNGPPCRLTHCRGRLHAQKGRCLADNEAQRTPPALNSRPLPKPPPRGRSEDAPPLASTCVNGESLECPTRKRAVPSCWQEADPLPGRPWKVPGDGRKVIGRWMADFATTAEFKVLRLFASVAGPEGLRKAVGRWPVCRLARDIPRFVSAPISERRDAHER